MSIPEEKDVCSSFALEIKEKNRFVHIIRQCFAVSILVCKGSSWK